MSDSKFKWGNFFFLIKGGFWVNFLAIAGICPRISATSRCAITPSLMSELNHSTIQSLLHPWMHHGHWSQWMWALCQDCHGPLTKLPPHTHSRACTHTHAQMGSFKPLSVPWVFAPLSALVGRAVKGSTPTWEQYLSSPEFPDLPPSHPVSSSLSLFSLLFSLLVYSALCPSSLHLSVYFCLPSLYRFPSFPFIPLFSPPGLLPRRPLQTISSSLSSLTLSQTGCVCTAVW